MSGRSGNGGQEELAHLMLLGEAEVPPTELPTEATVAAQASCPDLDQKKR